jgi:site-specific recombinase XerD
MTQISNKRYRQFLDTGIFESISEADVKIALSRIRGSHVKEGRALLIGLYYTGCRPNEMLKLKSHHVKDNGDSYYKVLLHGSKGGLPRTIYLQKKRAMVKEFAEYCLSLPPDMYAFFHYRDNYVRLRDDKKGNEKSRLECTNKLRWFFKIWFGFVPGGITPYFLRHNRFSKLSEKGASMEELRQIKGSKSFDSVYPYLHLSSKTAKSVAKKIE